MKRICLLFAMLLAFASGIHAMSYKEARERAWFLTDKMAYELNLTPAQYDRAYEINLDYLMSIRTPSDCSGTYWRYRDVDLRHVLFDWQYKLYRTLSYFYRPVVWVRSSWHYPVCKHYRYGYYYFEHPSIYASYRGRNWRSRGRNDRSPYYRMHFDRVHGLRDRYKGKGWYKGHPGKPHKPKWDKDDDDDRWDRDWDDDDRKPRPHRKKDFYKKHDRYKDNHKIVELPRYNSDRTSTPRKREWKHAQFENGRVSPVNRNQKRPVEIKIQSPSRFSPKNEERPHRRFGN